MGLTPDIKTKNNFLEKTVRNRKLIVIKTGKVLLAGFLPCSSLKGNGGKGERDRGLLSKSQNVICVSHMSYVLVTALKRDPTSGATKLAV